MKHIHILLFSICVFNNVFAQDPIFVTNHNSLMYLNPSFAGSNGGFRYQSTYRNQWINLSGSYITLFNSADVYIKRIKAGIALTYFHDDQSGIIKTDAINLVYAQHISLRDNKLKIIPSLQFGVFQKTLDNSKLYYASGQIGPNGFLAQWPTYTNEHYTKKANLDFSAGVLINYKHLYIAASAFHFTQPDEGLMGVQKLSARLNLYASYNLLIKEKTLIAFFIKYENQHHYSSLQLGAHALLFKHLTLGTSYKSNDIFSFNLGYRNNYFTMQVGYDAPVSRLSNNTAGSLEAMLSLNLRNKDNRKTVTDMERW